MRIGRVGFVLGHLPLIAAAYWHNGLGSHIFYRTPPEFAGTGVLLTVVTASWFLTVLRCHDFNETVWNNFWTEQVPVIGQVWALAELLFKPGTPGSNSFGTQPFL
jgi:uncharacterized membrane protein YhaH (DUF805 family)